VRFGRQAKKPARVSKGRNATGIRNIVPYFTIRQIKKKCLKGEFIDRSREIQIVESGISKDGIEETDTGKTVYIGSTK